MIDRLVLLCVILLLSACEPPPDVEPLPCKNAEPGQAELGIGDLATGFVPLADGEDLEIIFGPQGMHMALISVRTEGLEEPSAGGPGTRLSIGLWVGGEVVGGTVNNLQPSARAGSTADYLGLRAIFTEAEIEVLGDKTARVSAVVTDGCGREIEADRDWTLVL